LDRGVDLHIGDASAPKVRERLPAWFATAFPDTRSFLILPVRIDERPEGFSLADRDRLAPPGPGPDARERDSAPPHRLAARRAAAGRANGASGQQEAPRRRGFCAKRAWLDRYLIFRRFDAADDLLGRVRFRTPFS